MKKILTVQDISCFGKCSITIALPVISAHTMFSGFTCKDLTDQLIPITDHWKSEKLSFNAIYTGYLGSAKDIDIARHIFREFRTPETIVFVDPVMGDNGKLYPAFDMEYAKQNAGLCAEADIIVPNLTEACLMTDTEYRTDYDEDYILKLLDRLAGLGAKTVVLTGVSLSEGRTGIYGLDTLTGQHFSYQNRLIPVSYHGTGDLFSSVSIGALMNGLPLDEAFSIAADYTAQTIEVTMNNPDKPWYGVDFEATLPDLIAMIH